jgi:Transcriptional regulator
MAAIADAAVAGHGLAWLPHWLVAADVAAGRLEIVLAHEQPYLYHVHAVWPKAALMPRRLRLAIDALAAGLPALMRGETA